MRPSMLIGGQGLPRATFVGSVVQSASSAAVTLNLAGAGAQPGDFCLVHVQPTFTVASLVTSTEGWGQDNFTWETYSYRTSVFRKRLLNLDPVTIAPNGDIVVTTLIYRGPNAAQRRSVQQQGGAVGTHVSAGFARSPNCVGVVGLQSHRDTAASPGSVTSPGGTITQRRDDAATFFRVKAVDALGRADYVDGAAVTWPGSGGVYYSVSQLYELLIT